MGHIHTAAILSRENSLRSRRLEVVGERENRRARGTVTRVSPSRAPVFSCAHYLQAPATQATRETAKLCLTTLDLAVKNLGATLDR